jgi:gamma-glutamyltranspeptidase/glutathione hydrolase/leukotriene-C4 hydrolase
VVSNITSDAYAKDTFMKINDFYTINDPAYYGADYYQPDDHGTTHMSVIAPNGDAVAVTSTINH